MSSYPCPSCGAPIEFRSAVTVYAVCSYCRASVLRQGVALELFGEVAALTEDLTIFQLGTVGAYEGEPFSLIGRVKWRWERGAWDEWYVGFPSGREGWLADAQGFCMMSFPAPEAELPPLEGLSPGTRVVCNGENFVVTDIKDAHIEFCAGELPFPATLKRTGVLVDASGEQSRFATFDYAQTPGVVYLGRYVERSALQLNNLKVVDGW